MAVQAATRHDYNRQNTMLVELSIIPIGNDSHISDELAEVLKIIEESGLPFELTPSSTCIEGNWAEVMPLIQLCHERVRARCPHVITSIKVEDDGQTSNKLTSNIASVEEKLGHSLRQNHTGRAVAK
ncbi:MAG: MTH1187 family thiamine-binding protein [Opitutaceae bacterium]